jgi:tetratricopeptide (TPR) repeat protein
MRIIWIEQYLKDAEAMIVRGGAEMEQGIEVLMSLLYSEPGYGSLHNHFGWAHLYFTCDLAQAELHLKAAIKFQPDFQAPYLHLGTLYVRQGRYTEAIEILNSGLTQPQANKAGMLELIGQAYEMRQEYRLAIKAYRQAMLSSMTTGEMNMHSEGIKRCRKKKWASMFNQ